MNKHFKVPKKIPLIDGGDRIKLDSGHGMLLWYRRALKSCLITEKKDEKRIKCVAVETAEKPNPGGLYYLKPSGGKKREVKNPMNYALSLGGTLFITWVQCMPHTFSFNGYVKYRVFEHDSPYLLNQING